MPKQKTRKGVAKRIRVTRRGKVICSRPGRRHLLSNKSHKRKRKMRRKMVLATPEARRMKRALT